MIKLFCTLKVTLKVLNAFTPSLVCLLWSKTFHEFATLDHFQSNVLSMYSSDVQYITGQKQTDMWLDGLYSLSYHLSTGRGLRLYNPWTKVFALLKAFQFILTLSGLLWEKNNNKIQEDPVSASTVNLLFL